MTYKGWYAVKPNQTKPNQICRLIESGSISRIYYLSIYLSIYLSKSDYVCMYVCIS